MPFPDIDPVLVQLGPFAIRWYALAYVAGILLGWRYATGLIRNTALWTRRPAPVTSEQMDDLVLWIAIGVIGGGRLGHVLFYTPAMIATDPLGILRVWEGGMSFHGGVIGVAIAMVVFAWRNKLDLLRIADVVAPAYPIGHFLGRIANFINGELWGRPSDVAWAMIFPMDPTGLPRHPSQLYEALLEGALIIAVMLPLFWKTRARFRPGVLVGTFTAIIATARFVVEFYRQPDEHLAEFALRTGLSMGQWLSIPLILASVAMIVWALRRPPLASGKAGTPTKV